MLALLMALACGGEKPVQPDSAEVVAQAPILSVDEKNAFAAEFEQKLSDQFKLRTDTKLVALARDVSSDSSGTMVFFQIYSVTGDMQLNPTVLANGYGDPAKLAGMCFYKGSQLTQSDCTYKMEVTDNTRTRAAFANRRGDPFILDMQRRNAESDLILAGELKEIFQFESVGAALHLAPPLDSISQIASARTADNIQGAGAALVPLAGGDETASASDAAN